MTFSSIKIPLSVVLYLPRPGDDFAWHKKEYWLVHAELKWAYWMGEWEVKGK